MPDLFDQLFTDDEGLAERCGLDWSNAAPRLTKVAYGTDGNFSSTDRWLLKSSACDFASRGIQAGHVLYLQRPQSTGIPEFRELFAVESTGGEVAAPFSVTLRRVGEAAGFGEPPGPFSGTLTGLSFSCWSAMAAIRNYTREIRDRYPVGATTTLAEIEASGAPAETIEALCVAKAFRWVFFYKEPAYRFGTSQSGTGAGGMAGDFGEKSKALLDEIKALEAILDDYYGVDVSPVANMLTAGVIRLNVRGRPNTASGTG
jgi:hypothetical protein